MADLGSSTWSEIANNNNATPPDGWPEGMNPSDVNNSAREGMADIKRFWNRINAVKTTGGTTTAYTLTYDVAAASYYAGEKFSCIINATCGATPTLNVNGLGALSLRKFSGGAYVTLAAGDLVANQPIEVMYNSGATTFDLIAMAADVGISVPSGTVFPYAGAAAPSGYLLCFGQAVSRTGATAALFAVCSTTYGVGDGATTFNLPDLRGNVVAGKDNMGGSAAGRITDFTGTTLGASGGGQRTSVMDGPNFAILAEGNAVTNPITVATNGHTHGNVRILQPTFILNYIIKT